MKNKLNGDRHSYILRIWRPDPDEEWRVMLKSVDGHFTRHFATITQLTTVLAQADTLFSSNSLAQEGSSIN